MSPSLNRFTKPSRLDPLSVLLRGPAASGLILPCLLLIVSGCVENEITGTTSSFYHCLNRGTGQGLSQAAAAGYCEYKIEVPIDVEMRATAMYYSNDDGVVFSGRLSNKSRDKIITGYTITIQRSDATPPEQIVLNDRWVEPSATEVFSIESSELKTKTAAPVGSFTWNVQNFRGLRIDVAGPTVKTKNAAVPDDKISLPFVPSRP
jgi:hypothetical protein